ncbi:dTDP-4-dehydrorhamnose reductase family protein [Nitrospira lenta]|uniref:dTDP-4-dehydrorhamnose reductase n=1 Tax=Nitrospira lenta TaxID=1436998 RepID=A0A330LGG8_9BACT|nr:SDR family oxidoreductase [Nitrospira lenta]SPP66211.1 dTDP-4-dehydrorhamnose reductase [Nitrospira lenta]
MKVLVIGASGMLGNAVLRLFAESPEHQAYGSVRSNGALRFLPSHLHPNVIVDVDVENADNLTRLFAIVQPDMVINCVGLVKQLAEANDPLSAILINALFPHRLAQLCEVAGARLVHLSTDCIFSGTKGMYTETDASDAKDLYGRSKFLGEVNYPHAITLRTSIIGHELNGAHSLVGWFLSQEGTVKGFKRAIFSGLPTVEIARLIRDHVIPHPELHGLYHVSAKPISKFELLTIVATQYGKSIGIVPDETFVLDRSLDSTRFRAATGFDPAPWPELIRLMHAFS